MKLTKTHLNLFTYLLVILSVFFITRYLYVNDLLRFPGSIRWSWIFASFIALMAGFFLNSVSWQQILLNNGIRVTLKEAYLSLGLTIFGKYIPGKVWLITGISGKIAATSGAPIFTIAMIATLLQILIILFGALIGMISLAKSLGATLIIAGYGLSLLFVIVFYLTRDKITKSHFINSNPIAKRWIKPLIKSISIPLMISVSGTWILWSLGFYLLCKSLSISGIDISTGFSFALASSVGILAIFTPGGLGVREGLLGVIMAQHNIDVQNVVSVSALSRLWFVLGELSIFVTSLFLVSLIWLRNKTRGNS